MKRVLLFILILAASICVSLAQESLPSDVREKKSLISLGFSSGTVDYYDMIFINFEYERFFSERFSAGLLAIHNFIILPGQQSWETEDRYEYRRHLYLYGMAYYRQPLTHWLSIRFGVGAGAGYHHTKDYGDGRQKHDNWMPYINLSMQPIITTRKGNEWRIPLLGIFGPSNVGWSPGSMYPWRKKGEWMKGLGIQIIYGYKF